MSDMTILEELLGAPGYPSLHFSTHHNWGGWAGDTILRVDYIRDNKKLVAAATLNEGHETEQLPFALRQALEQLKAAL